MDQTLDQLQTFIAANPERAFFNPPAETAAIASSESAIGFKLPASYRAFLCRFNGGFINIYNYGPSDKYWSVKTARWNSNWLFGTNDLVEAYQRVREMTGLERPGYIPFCHTHEQESLVFLPSPDGSEPAVFDASHETGNWLELYPNFPSLLQVYVERKGNIETIASGL
ncbi:MAG TPA: SMI1/KNR4 family protein [Tepidisphaeraceae bacterium]